MARIATSQAGGGSTAAASGWSCGSTRLSPQPSRMRATLDPTSACRRNDIAREWRVMRKASAPLARVRDWPDHEPRESDAWAGVLRYLCGGGDRASLDDGAGIEG